MAREAPWHVRRENLDMEDKAITEVQSLVFQDGGSTVDIIRDEDDMTSDDAAALATQQSIKKYVDDTILTEEEVEDFVGGMLGGTETFISVTYQDATGDIDFVVPVLDEDDMATDSAAHLATQQSIKKYTDDVAVATLATAAADVDTDITTHAAVTTSVHNFDAAGDAPPQAHASDHAVSGGDTIFPADPGADRYLMWDDDPGQLVWDAGGGGSGDVTGPAASTDNMIARHDGVGGKTLQDYTSNPPTVSDAGDMDIDGDLDVENIVVSGTVDGRDVSTDGGKLDGIAAGADVTGSNAPQAHKDSHDPNDGSDALDTANASDIPGVQAAGTGTSHSLARADHQHQIQESMADNAIVTINQADVAENDIAGFTATGGLKGRSYSEHLADTSREDSDINTLIQAQKIDDLTQGDDNTDLDASTTRHGLVPKAVAPAANILNVMGIANGETALSNKAIHDATNPAALAAAAAPGTSLICSHRDHVHLDPVVALKAILTTAGDIIYATAASTWARLAKGTAGKPLVMNSGATAPQWGFINRMAGITPTQTGWDTAPTNLTNATDEDDSTVTGTGIDNLAAWASSGEIKFDMGATYTVLCRIKYLLGTDHAGCSIRMRGGWSTDDANYYNINSDDMSPDNWISNTTIILQSFFMVKARYLKFFVRGSGAANHKLAIYELEAWDIGG